MFKTTTKPFSIPKKKTSEYLFFWSTQGASGCFSQWFYAPMTIDDIQFANCEQYMMYRKALLFDDVKVAEEILKTDNPKTIKELGRKVKNYDEATWAENRYAIVLNGNLHKFSQNPELLKVLLKHKGKTFVEASPYDRIWGIGYKASNAIGNEKSWGLNLLGKVLTELSQTL